MSYRVRGLGSLDRELERKIAEKYNLEDEGEIVEWILAVLKEYKEQQNDEDQEELEQYIKYPEDEGIEHFHKWLKDGIVLCLLMNALENRRVCKYKTSKNSKLEGMRRMNEMDNISHFLSAAEKYGVKKIDLFQTVCLYEKTNMSQVHVALYKLGSVAQTRCYNGPSLGVKVAEKKTRQFTEDQLREGSSIIGLQMGTNQVASQTGMTPYGLGRQLVSK